MKGWNEGITDAIIYMEENLTNDIDIHDIADKANVSTFISKKYSMPCVDLRSVNILETAV